ncbi:glycosyltransferase [Kitasatospora sp. NBC_00315]|uniref:glycosyltransferase n=1 Tax=Kitasatospora sp. NBC_00315 TaxID=2975963 RepID=UPI00324B3E32
MRVLFTTLPGYGHAYPMIPIATALRDSGHDVLFCCAPGFGRVIGQHGFATRPSGIDYRVGQEAGLVPSWRAARAAGDRSYPYTGKVLVEFASAAMLPDVLRTAESWRPDLIVRDAVEFSGCVVGEALGIPHATGRDNRFLSPEIWRAEAGAELDALRAAVGLPPDPGCAMLYRRLGLVSMPPSFVSAVGPDAAPDAREFNVHVSPTMRFVQPRVTCDPAPALPDHLVNGDRPLVFVSLGTIIRDDDLLDRIGATARTLGVNILIAVGPQSEGANTPRPQVTFMARVPVEEALRRSAVVITTGASGLTVMALSLGKPVLTVPLAADQPINALRCEALGAGVRVSPQAPTAEFAEALGRLLHDPAAAAAARAIEAECRALPTPDQAVGLLADLVAQGGTGI